MGLFGMLNKKFGYSEENMIKSFNEILPAIGSQSLCSVGVSLKTKSLLKSKVIASGFAAITNTNLLVVYTVIPVKEVAIYGYTAPKKLLIKEHMGNKVVESELYNIRSQDFESLILEIAPSLSGFPNQQSDMEYFISILESYIKE